MDAKKLNEKINQIYGLMVSKAFSSDRIFKALEHPSDQSYIQVMPMSEVEVLLAELVQVTFQAMVEFTAENNETEQKSVNEECCGDCKGKGCSCEEPGNEIEFECDFFNDDIIDEEEII